MWSEYIEWKGMEMRSPTMLSEVNGEVEGDAYPTLAKFQERQRCMFQVH